MSEINKNNVTEPAVACEAPNSQQVSESWTANIKYVLIGFFFGLVLYQTEVISWFRIQEMFRLQSFHMYGVIGSAVVTGIISVQIIKRFNIHTITGESVFIPAKTFNKGQIFGGLIFGLGWGITGSCPGPIFAQLGSGYPAALLTLFGALTGTWMYGRFREKLPH